MTAQWEAIPSPYPETSRTFLVQTMHEKELLAEKITALLTRGKGRDLFDVWFLIKSRFDW